ncbi:MAG: hypothetical protein PWP76_517, partial [Candidatus Diapherotrites archaeon]|nr:hypothetical protein [Candidatus Diapherotrites archaeon]
VKKYGVNAEAVMVDHGLMAEEAKKTPRQ